MFVDSHCHLNFPELRLRLAQIRADMHDAQVDRALCICTTLEEFDQVHDLALTFDNFWASVGVHPDNEGVTEPSVADLVRLAALPRVVAIGETGLDYFRRQDHSLAGLAGLQWQRDRFKVHIEAAHQSGLPLVVHTRSASDDTLGILREFKQPLRGVFHCFTESWEVAEVAIDLGFYISFSGILTFKNAQDLREVARRVPLSRCLIETDSPYLAPVPYRGQTNTPAWVPYVAQTLAQIKGCDVAEVAAATTHNFETLFSRTLVEQAPG